MRVVGANRHTLLGGPARSLGLRTKIKIDVVFDVLNRPVCPGCYCLYGGAGEPIDDTSTGQKTHNRIGIKETKDEFRLHTQFLLNDENQRKYHGGGSDHCGT